MTKTYYLAKSSSTSKEESFLLFSILISTAINYQLFTIQQLKFPLLFLKLKLFKLKIECFSKYKRFIYLFNVRLTKEILVFLYYKLFIINKISISFTFASGVLAVKKKKKIPLIVSVLFSLNNFMGHKESKTTSTFYTNCDTYM